jgi:hypothetical protein
VVDIDTDAVLRHAQAEAPQNSTLAIQQQVLAAIRTSS